MLPVCRSARPRAHPERRRRLGGQGLHRGGPLELQLREDRRDRRDLVVGRGSAEDPRALRGVGHRGMFPCFFGGMLARLVRRARNALITVMRVEEGSMTPSSSPRSAARNGLATL